MYVWVYLCVYMCVCVYVCVCVRVRVCVQVRGFVLQEKCEDVGPMRGALECLIIATCVHVVFC